MEKINRRKKLTKQGAVNNRRIQYDSVVSEFKLEDGESIIDVIAKLFKFGRKLKPLV